MIFNSTNIVKLMEEYNVGQFKSDGMAEVYDDDIITQYPVEVFNSWFALNFVIYLNLIKFNLFVKIELIPLIKVYRQLMHPFSFGLKESKEFVENLVDIDILEYVDSEPRYIFTKLGDDLLVKLNKELETYNGFILNLFAKSLLMGDNRAIDDYYSPLKNDYIINSFKFENIYNEEKEKLEI